MKEYAIIRAESDHETETMSESSLHHASIPIYSIVEMKQLAILYTVSITPISTLHSASQTRLTQ